MASTTLTEPTMPHAKPHHGMVHETDLRPWLMAGAVMLVGFFGLTWIWFQENAAKQQTGNTSAEIAPLAQAFTHVGEWQWESSQASENELWREQIKQLVRGELVENHYIASNAIDPWRAERWEFQFRSGHTLESYAIELDMLGIELGLLDKSNNIQYLSNLQSTPPTQRIGTLAQEKRFYTLWRDGSLKIADAKYFAQANLNATGKWIAHFYPNELVQQMAEQEALFARGRPLSDIRRTTFRSRTLGLTFEVIVLKQEYHDGTGREATYEELEPPPPPRPAPPANAIDAAGKVLDGKAPDAKAAVPRVLSPRMPDPNAG